MIMGPDFQPSPTCAIMPIVIVYHENLYVNFTHSKYLFIRPQYQCEKSGSYYQTFPYAYIEEEGAAYMIQNIK